jgi:lipopolysaccharide/colanic/teichoic acid biosynthesis glycosyltransferase
MKRILDTAISLLALVLLAPVFFAIALAVKIASPGAVFYRGKRVGLNGRMFNIIKFRSMVENAEKLGGSATANDDPRLTSIGSLLRKYKLDELPQFINVLVGDMSLVGPRPEVLKYTNMYSEGERRILQVLPGMTDWASIWDVDEGSILAGSPDPEAAYEALIRPTKIHLQLQYIDNRSIVVDLRILAYTLLRLCNKRWLPREIATLGVPPSVSECGDPLTPINPQVTKGSIRHGSFESYTT